MVISVDRATPGRPPSATSSYRPYTDNAEEWRGRKLRFLTGTERAPDFCFGHVTRADFLQLIEFNGAGAGNENRALVRLSGQSDEPYPQMYPRIAVAWKGGGGWLESISCKCGGEERPR